MAGRKGTLTVRVVADTKAAEQGLDRFTTKVSSTGDKLQSAGKKMTMFATIPIAGAMGLATKAASDLEQAVGGTEAVFGDASDAIDEYADKAAKGMGLSEREFREATTSIGGQLKRMTGDVDLAADQSIKLAGVAADLAATYGGTTAEAVQALGAAFRGEADPAERFNLNLKIGAVNAKAVEMGLASSTTEVDENARAQATLALIMEQSADAQGQFAREADTAAGSMQTARAEFENASAELGDSLAPILAKVAGGAADMAASFGELPEPVQNGVLAIAGLIAVSGPVLTVAGRLATGWTRAGSAMETAGIGALYAKDKIGTLARTVGGVAVGVGAIYAVKEGLDALGLSAQGVEANIDELARTSTRELVEGWRQLEDLNLGVARNEFRTLAEEAYGTAVRVRDGLAEAGVETEEYDRILRQAADGERRAAADADIAAQAISGQGDAADEAKGPTKDLGDAADEAASMEERLADAIKGVNDALTAQFDPLFAARDALRKNQEAQWKVMEATDAVTEAQRHYNEVEEEFGKKSPEARYAYHQLEDANRKLADAKYDTAEAALDAQTATSELARKMAAGEVDINSAKASLQQWVDQGLITQDQANQTAGELENVARQAGNLQGRNIVIPVDADTSGFLNKVSGLYQNNYGEVSVRVGGGGVIRHTGGPVQAGHAYITGGRGREELFVPHADGAVLSPGKTRDALAGGRGVTNHISVTLNGGDHDATSVAHHIAWMLAR